jgi:hypothetical protein
MMVYSTYQLLIHVGFSSHAHNLVLNVAAEQGMVAVCALLVTWTFFAGLLWEKEGQEIAMVRYLPTLAAALALVTMIVHGMVDDPFFATRAVVFLFVPLAFIVPLDKAVRLTDLRLINVILVAALVAGLAVSLLLPALRATWYANLGAVRQGQIELAVYSWPVWPIQDEVRRREDLSDATRAYSRALALNPNDFSANRRLGQIELSQGAYESARARLQTAYGQLPWDNATRQLLGEALIATGQVAEGRALWATVNNDQDQLLARQFWYEYIGDNYRHNLIEETLDP